MISPGTITAAFSVLVVISNAISAKLIPLPLFDSFAIPAGLITYPLTFLLSDLITELYGAKEGRRMVMTALALSLLSYAVIQIALWLPSHQSEFQESFDAVLGLNGWIVLASLTAFLASQTLDVQLYALIRKWTGDRMLWLRNNGSTLISQLADTALVNWIFLHYGMEMESFAIFQVMVFSYAYKAVFSIGMTPLFYWLVRRGKESPCTNSLMTSTNHS
jgi:uncharacterized integral membrane protein (TIGR00697 family)